MSNKEKWENLTEYEKNMFISDTILGLDSSCREFSNKHISGFGMLKDYLNWEGYGKIVEKSESSCTEIEHHSDNKYSVTLFTDNVYLGIADTPWEAAAVAYLEMKGTKL